MKESGIGRENGVEAFEACEGLPIQPLVFRWRTDVLIAYLDSQSKSTIMNIADVEESRISDDWFAEESTQKRYG